jgi:hypothetical protein
MFFEVEVGVIRMQTLMKVYVAGVHKNVYHHPKFTVFFLVSEGLALIWNTTEFPCNFFSGDSPQLNRIYFNFRGQ